MINNRVVIKYLLLLLLPFALFADPQVDIDPTPSWVNPISPSLEWQPSEPSGGIHYLFINNQCRATADTLHFFHRLVRRPVTIQGVEQCAQILISFAPTHQTLTLHEVRVIRDGRLLDKLDKDAITLLQREEKLDRQLLYGKWTALLLLDDVCPGDVVDYSYTITGLDPVLKDRFNWFFDIRQEFPVGQIYYSLSWERERPLSFKLFNGAPEPQITDFELGQKYVWNVSDTEGHLPEGHTPSWYNPIATVELSDFPSWGDVVAWAQPVYEVPETISHELAELAQQFASLAQEEAIVRALNYVQQNIRYFGIQMGASSWIPANPSQTLALRYGDCKGKSMLLVTLLRRLGIEAHMVLVDTHESFTLHNSLPSAAHFNHAIVLVEHDGQQYWLDPTIPEQGGTLDRRAHLPYYSALVVREGETELSSLPEQRLEKQIHESFDFSSGVEDPGSLFVSLTFYREIADDVRDYVANCSHEEVERHFLAPYRRKYGSFTPSIPFAIKDNRTSNRMTVSFGLEVPDLWEALDSDEGHRFSGETKPIGDYLPGHIELDRKAPLYEGELITVSHSIEAQLPQNWPMKEETDSISNPFFSLRKQMQVQDDQLHIEWTYQRLATHILPEDLAAYESEGKTAKKLLRYSLTTPDAPVTPTLPIQEIIVWAAFVLGLATAGFIHLQTLRQRFILASPTLSQTPNKREAWYLLLTLDVLLSPFYLGAVAIYSSQLTRSATLLQVVFDPTIGLTTVLLTLAIATISPIFYFFTRSSGFLFSYCALSYIKGICLVILLSVTLSTGEATKIAVICLTSILVILWIRHVSKSPAISVMKGQT